MRGRVVKVWFAGVIALWAACDREPALSDPGERVTVRLTAALYDARDRSRRPTAGRVEIFRADGESPARSGGLVIPVGADGILEADLTLPPGDSIVVLAVAPPQPLQPVSRAVRVTGDRAHAEVYLSDTVIAGRVLDLDGAPVEADIWILRSDGSGLYLPFSVPGGHDFLSPIHAFGSAFVWDTDPLGGFAIPVPTPIPADELCLVFLRDRSTVEPSSVLTGVYLVAHRENRVPDVILGDPGPDVTDERAQ